MKFYFCLAVSVFSLATFVSCSSVGKPSDSKLELRSGGAARTGRGLPEELETLGSFYGTWRGVGRLKLPMNDKGPEFNIIQVIKPGLNGKAVIIDIESISAGKVFAASHLILFLNSENGKPHLASYEASAGERFPEIRVHQSPLSIEGRKINWSTVESILKPIQREGGSETFRSHSRYTYELRSSNELYESVESSDDGKQWKKLFEVTLSLAN